MLQKFWNLTRVRGWQLVVCCYLICSIFLPTPSQAQWMYPWAWTPERGESCQEPAPGSSQPGEHPSIYVCRKTSKHLNVTDCDDTAFLYCLQFPSDQCWQIMFEARDRDPEVTPGTRTGHVVAIINRGQNADGTWRMCVVEPYESGEIYCWDSPTPNPTSIPSDDIKQAICNFPGYHWWVDCSEPITIEDPIPPSDLRYCRAGETPWWECGSYQEVQKLCYDFQPGGEAPRIECLPPEMRSCLQSCDSMYNLLDPNYSFCRPGDISFCRNEDGDTRAIFCCQNTDGGNSYWCPTPQPTELPLCSELVGQSCNPTQGTHRDCVDSRTTPVKDNLFVRYPEVRCVKCPNGNGHCWQPFSKASSLSTSGSETKAPR